MTERTDEDTKEIIRVLTQMMKATQDIRSIVPDGDISPETQHEMQRWYVRDIEPLIPKVKEYVRNG